MIWPFRRKVAMPPPMVETNRAESSKVRETAEQELKHIKSRANEVSNASRHLRDIRERNHFAEMIGEALAEKQE